MGSIDLKDKQFCLKQVFWKQKQAILPEASFLQTETKFRAFFADIIVYNRLRVDFLHIVFQ